MSSPFRVLLTALARFLPHPRWWLGKPLRATIAPVEPSGHVLLVAYTNGTDWATLSPDDDGPEWTALSTRVTDDPLQAAEFTEVETALAKLRLVRTEPWAIDADGRLCASIAVERAAADNIPPRREE